MIHAPAGYQRELARVPSGSPGLGPEGVTLSPDRRTAYVSWSSGEFSCSEVGAIRTDGRGTLRTIDNGIGPAVSPDGAHLSYFRANGPSCINLTIVVVDLHDGTRRNIKMSRSGAYSYGGGPWWRADSRHLIAPIAYPGEVGASTVVRQLDSTTARAIRDSTRIDLTCGAHVDIAHYPLGVTRDDRVLLANVFRAIPTTITSCNLHTHKARRLIDFAAHPEPFGWSIAGQGLVFVDTKGVLWRWDGHKSAPTHVATGTFQSVAG